MWALKQVLIAQRIDGRDQIEQQQQHAGQEIRRACESVLAHDADVADREQRRSQSQPTAPNPSLPFMRRRPRHMRQENHHPDAAKKYQYSATVRSRGGWHNRERHQSSQNMQPMQRRSG